MSRQHTGNLPATLVSQHGPALGHEAHRDAVISNAEASTWPNQTPFIDWLVSSAGPSPTRTLIGKCQFVG
jgi:hypothetical protein